MPWKLDDKKQFVTDEKGNPIWISESGVEKGVDYPDVSKRITELTGENADTKKENRKLKESLSVFEGIEDLKSWKDEALAALEFKKNAPDKDKELEAQIAARLESEGAKFQAQIAAKDKSLGEKEKLIEEQNARIRQMSIGADVKNSKIIVRVKPEVRTLLEREMLRIGDLDEENQILYRDGNGKPFYNAEGKYATREEVPLLLMKELGIDSGLVLMKEDGSSGSGGLPNGGTGGANVTCKKYSEMSQEEKIAYLKNSNNLRSGRN